MELWWIVPAAALILCVFVLLLQLLLLRRSMREIVEELDEKLDTDTNTLLSVSSGDRGVRALAAQLNTRLQRLRAERLRLQNGDAELKAAVTNISHDLRTPLTAICGYLDLLEQEPHSEKSVRYLAVIRERTDAMRVLTEELLQYSLISSTAGGLCRESVSLNAVLEQSLAGLYAVLSARGIAPEVQLPEEKILRTLDGAALRRVFDNIINNAARYSDGDLTVTLSPEGTATFSNRAEKLDRIQVQQLFDRFFTVETASGSTGLGLSIAKLLTEKMGGRITAEYAAGVLSVRVAFPV